MRPPQGWWMPYIGRPYRPGEFDCADLAVTVQREVFGRDIALPSHARGAFAQSAQIRAHLADFGEPTRAPEPGDAVLLWARGRLAHIGVFYRELNGQPGVLHATSRAMQVTANALHTLPSLGLEVEGFYRWKLPPGLANHPGTVNN